MNFRAYFTCLCLVFLALGCEPKDAPKGGDGPAPVDFCAGKSCGDPCSTCPEGAVCAAVEEVCNVGGECVISGTESCDYQPCAGNACGAVCAICDPADTDCLETAVEKACNADGFCVADGPGLCDSGPVFSGCYSSEECADGEICTVDLGACEACGDEDDLMTTACCGGCVSAPSGPCEGKNTGACCDPCEDNSGLDCLGVDAYGSYVCSEEGVCQPVEEGESCGNEPGECSEDAFAEFCCCDGDMLLDPVCVGESWECPSSSELFFGDDCWAEDGPCMLPPAFDEPCEGKECGAPCTLCHPEDVECAETDESSVCDEMGECVSEGTEQCPVFGECVSNDECGEDELCTAEYGDCFPCADCPECDVCCGLCVEKTFDDQCADQPCGATCEACAPEAWDCWSDQPHVCNGEGTCVPEPGFSCDEPSDQCNSSFDCGAGEICTVDFGGCDMCDDCPMCDVCCGDCIPAPADVCGEKSCGDDCNPCDGAGIECPDSPSLDFQCIEDGLCGLLQPGMCQDTSMVSICAEELPADPFTILEAVIVGDSLNLTLQYGGGCEDHLFSGCFGAFMESFPVQVNLQIGHDANNDGCLALPISLETFDLGELKAAYQSAYQTESGTILLQVDGWVESLSYSF